MSSSSLSSTVFRPVTLFDGAFTGKFMLNAGAPGPHILKRVASMMKKATAISMDQTLTLNGALLQYGTPDGPPEFLDALSSFLSAEYREPVNRDNLVLSAGATSGFIYLLSQIFPHKTIVWAEQLSYFLAISMLKNSLAFPIRDIKIESDGIDLEDLEAKWSSTYSTKECEEAKENGKFLGALYLIPHYHNPTGTELSPQKCQKIIELARKYSILVFCDDVYNILHYNDKVSRRLFAYDNPKDENYGSGHVISNGTFSKLLSPGLRVGWIEMPLGLKKKYWSESWIMRSGGSVNPYTAGIITELLKGGQVSNLVKEIRVENKAKMEALLMILADELPKECQILHKPTGGYFVYIKLPDSLVSTKVIEALRDQHQLLALDGQSFWSGNPDDSSRKILANGIRLAVAYPLLDEIIEGAHIFCATIKDLLLHSK